MHCLFDRGDIFKRQRPRHGDADIADDIGPRVPQPHRIDARDARHLFGDAADTFAYALGRRIDELVEGAAAQAEAGNRNEDGDAHGGDGVALQNSRNAPR